MIKDKYDINRMRGFLIIIFFLMSAIIGFAQGGNSEYREYFDQLHIKDISHYKYVVFYPINHSFANDSHWHESFINAEQVFKEMLFIVVIDEPNQLNTLSDYAHKRNNLIIDSMFYFQTQPFYSYYPFYCPVEDGRLLERVHINYRNAYGAKVRIYQRFMK